ncbi:MAG TPA: hypothetical protein PKC87_06075, partial [Candidatus Absconditabacterales bacterium]|nr:hypothetical protein [Candidatus Absconditabacterales bacterium]
SPDIKISFIEKNGELGLKKLLSNTFTGVVRLDCVLDQSGNTKILEINADYPDGLLMHDFTYSVISGFPTIKNLAMYQQLFDKNHTIFVLYKKGTFFVDAYYTEYYLLQQLGYTCYIGTEEDLTFDDGNVFFKGNIIHVIRRCMEIGKFTEGFLHDLSSYNVHFINSFDLRILGYKNLLQEIESPSIPKTFVIHHNNIDILLAHKDSYVIKPSNLFEGKGVYIGKYCEPKDWELAVKNSIHNNYIAQEFIDMQKMKVQMYDNGSIVEKELYFDVCPHIFVKDGKVIGDGLILMRFSENRILNVAQGGGIGYLKI